MDENKNYFAIAITRTCGSGGGSYIGKKNWRLITGSICMTESFCVWHQKTAESMRRYLQMQMKIRKKLFFIPCLKKSLQRRSHS